MSRFLVSLKLDAAQRAAFDEALDALDRTTAQFIVLAKQIRGSSQQLGERDGFCRGVADAMHTNPELRPPGFDLAKLQDDIELMDFLRPRSARLAQLTARTEDTLAGLGIDVLRASREGYRMIRAFGQGSGIEELGRELGQKLRARPKAKAAADAAKAAKEPEKA